MWKFMLVAVTAVAAFSFAPVAVAQPLPDDFVYLRELDPSIQQDIRYAGENNFVGRPLAGYDAAECVVKRNVALLLQSIQQELALQGLSLKMLDCYRPVRAARDMIAWARDGNETRRRSVTIRRSPRPICSGSATSPNDPVTPPVPRST